ncbi:Succinate-semialdehyde dehydrogenase, mitochondrial [Aphelenchoides fujianensis]|nr:Succinate-semialdehyde dehydrogenase, mitochondrial [Aphelenchoides fujianensis]
MLSNFRSFRSPTSPFVSRVVARTFQTSLLPDGGRAFINGRWIKANSDRKFEVKNPYTRDVLCEVADCDLQDANLAVESAKQAFEKWGYKTTGKERGELLRKWADLHRQHETELAELLTQEQGKPVAEARAEIQYSAGYLDWYAGEARRIYGEIVPSAFPDRSHYHVREPIGVVASITPWNFPSAMIARKAAAALAAGCTFVVKPAHETPLSALALAETAKQAGIPPGVFNVIPASHEHLKEISPFFCESPDVSCISFTGSTAVGKLLLKQCASSVKRVCLELGGNAPFIVFESADVQRAVQGALSSKTRASGQTCVSANRYFVHEAVHDKFVAALGDALKKLRCGDGMTDGVTQGPLISEKAVGKVQYLVDDALDKGAKLVMGGECVAETHCYKPTILTDVTEKMELTDVEIFGPVVAIQKFTDETDVLRRANSTPYGLAGYIFTQDLAQIHRVTRRLNVGILGVNEGAVSCPEAAFGGVKESGLGREGGRQGIDEFTQWKYITITH